MVEVTNPSLHVAPAPSSKTRKIKDQQEGGGFIYNNSNKSNNTTSIKPNSHFLTSREDIIIDRGGGGLCSLITRLPKVVSSTIHNQEQQQQQQSTFSNNNKSNFFSSSSKSNSNYSSLSKPMEISKPPPLQPYTPTSFIRNSSNNSSIPSSGELEYEEERTARKWAAAMAKSAGEKPPKKPEQAYIRKRPMGSNSVSYFFLLTLTFILFHENVY